MKHSNLVIKNKIIEEALTDVAFDGWTVEVLRHAAVRAGYSADMVLSVFPADVKDAVSYFSEWADEKMMETLRKSDAGTMRVRDRVAFAVQARLDILLPHKEAVRLALAYWARPFHKRAALKSLWRTADLIWIWAGDTATDYNRYSKRSLLCGVLGSTVLFWLNDTSSDGADSTAFLDRRIENALAVGKIAGKFKTA